MTSDHALPDLAEALAQCEAEREQVKRGHHGRSAVGQREAVLLADTIARLTEAVSDLDPDGSYAALYSDEVATARREFLLASVAVWQEIDRLSVGPEGYRGLDASTDLRHRERAAWERYKAVLSR